MNISCRIILSILLCVGIAAYATAQSAEADLPHVAITGFANKTGDASFDTPGQTAAESLALTLRMLGSYRVIPPDGAPVDSTDENLALWCGGNGLDYALYGTITNAKDGSQLYSLSLFDRAKGKTTIRKTAAGSSVFDVFSAADTLTFAVIDAITGYHVGFGSIAFDAPGATGSFRVSIDGFMVGESLAPIANVAEGHHLVSVSHGTAATGMREIALKEIEIAEGETTTVTVAIRTVNAAKAQGTAELPSWDNSEMAFVEGGSFTMGSDEGPLDERPAHEVKVDSFWMRKKEISIWDYVSLMGKDSLNERYQQKPKEVSLPFLADSWINAIKYCNERSKEEGLEAAYEIEGNRVTWNRKANGYRLPTEAEWEYAAKGGKNRDPYPYPGSYAVEDVAWTAQTASGRGYRASGIKMWNSLGLCDMGGNVYEWCWDYYARYDKAREGNGKDTSARLSRVIRGGDTLHGNAEARCTARSSSKPELLDRGNGKLDNSRHIGFRIVRSAIGETE